MAWNVLIFEDDIDLCRQWTSALGEAGHRATVAGSGSEAVAWCLEEDFDLMIVDMYLVGPDGAHSADGGLKLIGRLRNGLVSDLDDRYRTVPIIAVTASPAFNGFDVLALARRSGANKVLRKPFSADQLIGEAEALMQMFADGGPGVLTIGS